MRLLLIDRAAIRNDGLYILKAKERNYLSKVLRLSSGTYFTCKDNENNYYKALLNDDGTLLLESTDCPEDTLLDNLSAYTGPFAKIDIYVSLLKGKKLEPVIKALTEIGVRRIVLVDSTFVQDHDISEHTLSRLNSIIKEAVQQSGARAPQLSGPIRLEDAIRSAENIFILHQSRLSQTKTLREAISSLSREAVFSLFIGPEGGFSDEECALAEEYGGIPVLLNTNILRAETASIYAASALQNLIQG